MILPINTFCRNSRQINFNSLIFSQKRKEQKPSKALANSYDFTAFGEKVRENVQGTPFNPWRFAAKRFDPELGLIYFGKRYYDPEQARWLTTDPAGFADSVHLYQYVLNNPFRYQDPRGENLLGFLWGMAEILAGGVIMVSGVALEIVTGGAYTPALGSHESLGLAIMAHGCSYAMKESGDIFEKRRSSPPPPDPRAEGKPHTIIERPGVGGQYTTYNADGTFKQYRGSGQSHGSIPRPKSQLQKSIRTPARPFPPDSDFSQIAYPQSGMSICETPNRRKNHQAEPSKRLSQLAPNVKENKINPSPSGLKPGSPTVREARPDEIPSPK
jgi:RHS repeat-associated protein